MILGNGAAYASAFFRRWSLIVIALVPVMILILLAGRRGLDKHHPAGVAQTRRNRRDDPRIQIERTDKRTAIRGGEDGVRREDFFAHLEHGVEDLVREENEALGRGRKGGIIRLDPLRARRAFE